MNPPGTSKVVTVHRVEPDEDAQPGAMPIAAPVSAWMELTKPGITRLVTITATIGLMLGGIHHGGLEPADWIRLAFGVILGTAFSSAGANALNQWYESDRDARMKRTSARPIPSSRLSPRAAFVGGTLMTILGAIILAIFCGFLASAVALFCAASYVVLYTPLKPLTVWNTLVGTIPGALPVMIGTASVAPGEKFEPLLDPIGLSLLALMIVWQIPHFLAIAWMFRDDYRQGGFRMLPIVDQSGKLTGAVMVLTSLLLIPASMAVVFAAPDLLGWATLSASAILGLGLVYLSARVLVERTKQAARKAFIGSIIHLPLLLIVMVAEALTRAIL